MEHQSNKFQVDADISTAKTIDTAVYHDVSIYRQLLDKAFLPSWQFITSCDELPEEGSVFPFSFLPPAIPEPLVVTKDGQGSYNCLSNVCTHRGNLLATAPCNSKMGLICKYHGRRFDLNGCMQFMPEFKEVKNFPTAEDNLPIYPIQKWGNWLFTTLGQSSEMNSAYRWMMEKIYWLPFHRFQHDKQYDREYNINANWALYCENYLEGFHIPFVHAGLNQVLDFNAYETICKDDGILQIGYAKEGELSFELPDNHPDFGKNIAAWYYFVFPNLMFNFYPWGLSLNIVIPVSVNTTRVMFKMFISDYDKFNQGAGSDLHTVEMEDEAIVENVQIGTAAMAYRHGRYSVKHEAGPHHFHRLLAAVLNG